MSNTNILPSQNDYFDDSWAIFIQDTVPAANAAPDQIYFYNSTVLTSSTTFPYSDSNVSTVYGPDDSLFMETHNDGNSALNGDLNNFTHTTSVTSNLDTNGDLSLWIAAETTQTTETAKIDGIANVSLSGSQLVNGILIPVSNTNETYDNQNLASWDFSTAGASTTTPYRIAGLDSSKYQSSITSSTNTNVQFEITDINSSNVIASFNLNSDSNATDSLTITSTTTSEDIDFNLIVQDSSGNTDSIHFDLNISAPSTNPPITIDLDGNGIEYLGLEAGVVFTDKSTGEAARMAWVGPNDGLLVIDANNSGSVDELREFVFTDWVPSAETDLEAVQIAFDSNKDEILNANDDQWGDFGVWVDSNSDGVSDPGEVYSLDELGIQSVNLNYTDTSEAYEAADGEVTIYGQAEVTFDDGSTTIAEDTAFARDEQLNEAGMNAEATPESSETLYSDIAIADLVDTFLAENPVEDDTVAQMHQELMEQEPDPESDFSDSLNDQETFGEIPADDIHEEDIDIEVDIEIVDITISDMVDTSSVNTVDDYSTTGV